MHLNGCGCGPQKLAGLGSYEWLGTALEVFGKSGTGSASGTGAGGGSSGGGSGGASASTMTAVTTTTTISPQISPQFIQQQSPTNSGINAGINPMPMPGMGAPQTGMLPGFDSFPFIQAGGVNPLLLLAGGGLILALVLKARSNKGKRR